MKKTENGGRLGQITRLPMYAMTMIFVAAKGEPHWAGMAYAALCRPGVLFLVKGDAPPGKGPV